MDLLTLHPAVYWTSGVFALLFWIYRRSIPTPLPGNIPYDPIAAKRPFGDIWEIIQEESPLDFFKAKSNQLKSPIFQVFIEPFGRTAVVISDSRESHDILAKRSREFDRAQFFASLFVSVAPNNQVCLPTNDQWHANRRLMADTMSPTFLAKSAAPQAAAAFSAFIDLWRTRAGLAKALPFNAEQDIDCALLDAISGIAFGSSSHATEVERDFAASSASTASPGLVGDEPIAMFERTPAPLEHLAVERLAHSTQIPAESLFGAAHHKFALAFYPKLRAAQKSRRKIVERQIQVAFEKFSNPEAGGDDVRSAADVIVQREIQMARKQGRKPDLTSPVIDDELFGFLVAGYDTTATTVKWGVKFLTLYPEVQTRLRNELHEAFADTHAQGGRPSIDDCLKRRPPYLDAVIEEILRLGNPGVAPLRTATADVTIFGHLVPKGTDVIMMNVGPGQTEPPFVVDESTRSKTSQESIETAYTGNWDPDTLGQFLPDRWLTKNANGEVEFNPRAGAQQTFGGGLRGCFGRKLAYVMMRQLFSMIVWEFELLPLSDQLGTFKNKVVLTNTPEMCYIRLKTLSEA